MDGCEDRLDELLSRWEAPPLARDLADAVLARARAEDQALDDLLLRADPKVTLGRDLTDEILARARQEEARLDRVLAAADAVPPLAGDLGPRVLRAVRRQRLRRRVMASLGGLAAAAAVLVAFMWMHSGPRGPQPGEQSAGQPRAVAPSDEPAAKTDLAGEDRLVVENLDVIQLAQDMPVYRHWETIRAMEHLEAEALERGDL